MGTFTKHLNPKDYNDVLVSVYRDASLAILSQSQMNVDRNARIMGSRAKDLKGKRLDRYLDTAISVVRRCQITRNTTYKNLFTKASRLLKYYLRNGNSAKVDKIKKNLVSIAITYNAYCIVEESAYWCYDEVYNQTEVLTTQGFHPPGEEEYPKRDDGPKRLVKDKETVDRETRAYHAAKDRAAKKGIDISGSKPPTFKEAFEESTKDMTISDEDDVDEVVDEMMNNEEAPNE